VDHTVEKQADVDGFGKLKLKIKNTTPGGRDASGRAVVERIPDPSSGTFVAIGKFHRNSCYRPDLSGEYGAPGKDWRACRTTLEEIVVSSPQPVPAGINDDAVAMSFTFPDKIPINATDVFLQVVYRGPLGDEPDAVVVATKDIAEPLFLMQYSLFDQFTYANYPFVDAGPNSFETWCLQGYESYDACRAAEGATLKVRFGPAPGYLEQNTAPSGQWLPLAEEPPLEAVATLIAPVGTFARVALLADGQPQASVFLYERATRIPQFKWDAATLLGNRNQFDFDANTLVPLTTYVSGRGIFVSSEAGPLLNAGNAPNIPALVPSPSRIAF